MEDEIEKGGEALVYAMISEVSTVKQPYGTIKPERCRVDYHGDQSLGCMPYGERQRQASESHCSQPERERSSREQKTFTNLGLSGAEKTALTKQIQLETTICNSQRNGKRFRNPGESGYGIKP